MSEILNPYIAGAPVVETSMFFGREDVFNWIERSLAGKYVDHILVLHGQRRVGKTSVLKQIPNFLPDRYIQVFFDLQGRTGTTLDRFLWWVASEIAQTLKTEHDISLPKPDRKSFEDTEYLIGEFLPGLRPGLGEKVLLLTFDEFDSLDRPEIQEEFTQPVIAYLRRLIEVDGLNFIFSIGSSGDKLENMRASYTDFFKSALYRKISFLTQDDCHRLITKPVEDLIRYDRKAVNQIFGISSGHPYFTQLICHELFSRCQKTGAREIFAKDVDAVLEDVIERGTVNLKFVWDEASDLEKWILAALAQLDKADVKKLKMVLEQQRVRFSDPDLNSAIIHLQDKDVIRQDLNFVIHLMRLWLVANRPMDRVREELVEINPIANRYVEIGDEYRDREQYQEAVESYQQALNVDAGNLKAQSSIAAIYLKQEAYPEAVIAFESALKIDDEDVVSRTGFCDANLALGDAARSDQEMEKALGYYQAILVISPAHTDARNRIAAIYQEQAEVFLQSGQDEKAIHVFKQAMMVTPEDERLSARHDEVLAEKKSKLIHSWLEKAEKALSRQRWDEAAEMVEEAIKVDPEDQGLQAKLSEVKDAPRQSKLEGYRREAEQAVSRGNWEKAIAALETAVLLAPEDHWLEDWLSAIQGDQLTAQLALFAQQIETSLAEENWDVATQIVQKAIKLAPEDESWQHRLEEIKQTRHQVRLDSLRAQARDAQQKKDWSRAIQLLEKYLELEESLEVRTQVEEFRKEKREFELTTFRSRAENAVELGNWSEAVKAWEAYLRLSPADAGSVESRVEHARKYARISSDYKEAQDAIRRRRYGKAIELLQGIIRQDPTYKSTSRLLVEAVEANKAIPLWRKPWLYGAIGVMSVAILGIFIGPSIFGSLSTTPETTTTTEGTLARTLQPEESTTQPGTLAVVDGNTGLTEVATPSPTPDLRVFNPENNHHYLYSGDSTDPLLRTWHDARDACIAQGGYLATIQDESENAFVFALTSESDQTWLGASDEAKDDDWTWVTGEPWEYTNWDEGEPNAYSGSNYLTFKFGPTWNDMISSSSSGAIFHYVCEWDPEPETLEPTPTPTVDQRTLNPDNQHFNRYFGDPNTFSRVGWQNAQNYCEALEGYLVTIQNAAENDFVSELAPTDIWLGATDEEDEGTWVWVTGEPLDYSNWDEGEPSNEDSEHYLYQVNDSFWHDANAIEEYRYVCEWDPEPDPRISIGATYSPIFKYIGSQLPTFEDNFSTAKGEWGSTSAGYWIPGMIQEETLVVMSPRTDTAFPINGLFKATDFALSFDFHPYGEDIGGVIGLVFRASERLGTYYQFKISFPMGRIKPYRAAWLFSTSDATIVRTTEQGLVSLPIDLTRLSLSSMERMRGSL